MNPKEKDDDIFNLNPKKGYDFEPMTYLKPVDAPSMPLRQKEMIPYDKNKPAVDLSAPIIKYYRNVPIDYMNYVNSKINYLHK